MKKCVMCQTENTDFATKCTKCDSILNLDAKPSSDRTMIIGGNSTLVIDNIPASPQTMIGWLVSVREPSRYVKILGEESTIGRSDESSINLENLLSSASGTEILTVSRQHARIFRDEEDQSIALVDLNSSNKTFIEDKKLKPYERTHLPDNALIAFGKVEMLFKQFNA